MALFETHVLFEIVNCDAHEWVSYSPTTLEHTLLRRLAQELGTMVDVLPKAGMLPTKG